MDPRLPNLIVIGAAKCGTSSLHYYLGLHPVDESFSSPRFSILRNESRGLRRKNRLGSLLERGGGDWLVRRIPAGRGRRHAARALYLPFSRRVDRPILEEGQRRRVAAALSEDVERLREITGRAFEKWSI